MTTFEVTLSDANDANVQPLGYLDADTQANAQAYAEAEFVGQTRFAVISVAEVTPSGPAGFTDNFSLNVKLADTNDVQTDDSTFAIALAVSDTNDVQSETLKLTFPAGDFGDDNPTPTEGRQLFLRCWASGCTTNNTSSGNTVAPANANGQNNGTFANVTTGTGVPDTTNPVTVTTGSMNVPAGLTVVSAKIRIYFHTTGTLAAVVDSPGVDIQITAPAALAQTLWNGPALAVLYGGENYDNGSFTVDLPGPPTLANLQAIVLQARYSASVVALPQYAILVDAWCVEIEATI